MVIILMFLGQERKGHKKPERVKFCLYLIMDYATQKLGKK
jgi:hypothetical protein